MDPASKVCVAEKTSADARIQNLRTQEGFVKFKVRGFEVYEFRVEGCTNLAEEPMVL